MHKIKDAFKEIYSEDPLAIYKAPARIELIGNHTDHNGGLAVVSTVDLYMTGAFSKRCDDTIKLWSKGVENLEFSLNDQYLDSDKGSLLAIVKGIIDQIDKERLTGLNIYIESDIPIGAGLSSSAAIESMLIYALNDIFKLGIDKKEMIRIAHKAETKYFQKKCGLLDQTAIITGGTLLLDFSSEDLIREKLSIDIKGYKIVLVKSKSNHSNLTYAYDEINSEMRAVAEIFGKKVLADLEEEDFYKSLKDLIGRCSGRAILRAMHFYQENKRVEEFARASSSNVEKIFEQINNSGSSSLMYLQNTHLPEDKNQEIPVILAIVNGVVKTKARRVHGGGFAGSVLCIVEKDNYDEFYKVISTIYSKDAVLEVNLIDHGVKRIIL